MDIQTLEESLQSFVGLPIARRTVRAAANRGPDSSLLQLRTRLEAVRAAASQIGQLPQGYPLHVDLLMRLISALLPWYTRPLRAFSDRVLEALDGIELCLTDLSEQRNAEGAADRTRQ